MNKAQLVDRIARKTQLSKTAVEKVLNATIETVKDSVQSDEDVTLLGFGTFTAVQRRSRAGHNPHTGKKMTIPEMKLPRFRPSKDFKELLQ